MSIPKLLKCKLGFTIIELIVAMAIFLIITTLVMGAFVATSKFKTLTSKMKDTQQKVRIATEMVNRFARQADQVTTTPGGRHVDMFFRVTDTDITNDSAIKMEIAEKVPNSGEYGLYLYNCNQASPIGRSCSSWGNRIDLLGEGLAVNNAASGFNKRGSINPVLEFRLEVATPGVAVSPYYSDLVYIETAVYLESLR